MNEAEDETILPTLPQEGDDYDNEGKSPHLKKQRTNKRDGEETKTKKSYKRKGQGAPFGDRGGSVPGGSLRTAHLRNIITLTRQALLSWDWSAAASFLPPLLLRSSDIPLFAYCAGVEVLKQQDKQVEVLRFIRRMAQNDPTNRESLILELALNYLSNSQWQEAYDVLLSYLPLRQYRGNHAFHGYCGIIAYTLWALELNQNLMKKSNQPFTAHKRRIKEESEQEEEEIIFEEEESRVELGQERMSSRARLLYKRAKEHLVNALELCGDSATYLQYYLSLLLYKSRAEKCRSLAEEFCERNPLDPNALRILATLLITYFEDEWEELRKCLMKLFSVDPFSDVAFYGLLQLYDQGRCRSLDIIEVVARKIEYYPSDRRFWECLWLALSRFSENNPTPEDIQANQLFWKKRSWWLSHFFHPRENLTKSDCELLVYKYVCSLYIMEAEEGEQMNGYASRVGAHLHACGYTHELLPLPVDSKAAAAEEEAAPHANT
jgi:hypothetical protein